MYHIGGNLFLKLTTDETINNSGENWLILLETDRNPVPTSIAFVRSCCFVVLTFLFRVFKSTEPLSFDSPADANVVKRPPSTYIYIF